MESRSKREILQESPLFDSLLPTELTFLADLFSIRDYQGGDVIFEEGAVGDSLYVIATGALDVLRRNPHGQPQAIAKLESPAFFGEMALIDKEYRSATVRAQGAVQLLQLSNENLHIFAKNYRNGFTWVVVNIARALSARLRDVNRRLAEKL